MLPRGCVLALGRDPGHEGKEVRGEGGWGEGILFQRANSGRGEPRDVEWSLLSSSLMGGT